MVCKCTVVIPQPSCVACKITSECLNPGLSVCNYVLHNVEVIIISCLFMFFDNSFFSYFISIDQRANLTASYMTKTC